MAGRTGLPYRRPPLAGRVAVQRGRSGDRLRAPTIMQPTIMRSVPGVRPTRPRGRWRPAVLAWAPWALVMLGLAAIVWLDHLLRRAGRRPEGRRMVEVQAQMASTRATALAGVERSAGQWRQGWDSNPWKPCDFNGFRDVRPLSTGIRPGPATSSLSCKDEDLTTDGSTPVRTHPGRDGRNMVETPGGPADLLQRDCKIASHWERRSRQRRVAALGSEGLPQVRIVGRARPRPMHCRLPVCAGQPAVDPVAGRQAPSRRPRVGLDLRQGHVSDLRTTVCLNAQVRLSETPRRAGKRRQ